MLISTWHCNVPEGMDQRAGDLTDTLSQVIVVS